MSTERKKPKYHIHENGFAMPFGFPVDGFSSALTYKPEEDDVFICTYPKCGTTWAQCILYLLLHNGNPVPKGKRIDAFCPHLEELGSDAANALPKPRLIKTHLPFHLTPKNPKAKYVYIARNPKDCCVSFFHHTKGFPRHYDFLEGTFDDFFEVFLCGETDFGDYFDNLISWYEHQDDRNVLFLLYEDMKENISRNIRRIGEFLGGPFEESCRDETILQRVVQASSFESMKKTPEAWSSQRPPEMEEFIRKGKVGDWRNYFSEEQNERLENKFQCKLRGTGAENLWENYNC